MDEQNELIPEVLPGLMEVDTGISILEDEETSLTIEVEAPIIEENSDSLLIEDHSSRFSGAVWFDSLKKQKVMLAGLGGIGSYVAFLLGRMQIEQLLLIDPDIVETVNLSGQLYGLSDNEQYKVYATANKLKEYARFHNTVTIAGSFDETSIGGPIMISGFDNMNARKVYFKAWKDYVMSLPEDQRQYCIFIDGRLALEEFQILSITGDDEYSMDKYVEDWLFYKGESTVCSMKQTSHMAMMIASYMVNILVNFVANHGGLYRTIPFLTKYNGETMNYTLE